MKISITIPNYTIHYENLIVQIFRKTSCSYVEFYVEEIVLFCSFSYRSINSDPFSSSPACNGYTGLLAHYFWSREDNQRDVSFVVKLESDGDADGSVAVSEGTHEVIYIVMILSFVLTN